MASATEASISFRTLLAYNHSETGRWHALFVQHPEALDIEVGGKLPKVRDLIAHIFQAEKFFAAKLSGKDLPAKAYAISSESLEDMFAEHEKAHAMLAQYLETADEVTLQKMHDLQFRPGLSVSSRKLLVQFIWHGINHWGQVAMLVRRAGIEAGPPHDIILSTALQ
jgi:uncharacterized damage-inducible protein DinB